MPIFEIKHKKVLIFARCLYPWGYFTRAAMEVCNAHDRATACDYMDAAVAFRQ